MKEMDMSSRILELLGDRIPRSLAVTNSLIDWQTIETEFADLIQPLQATKQDPEWHAEGNVWTHTQMVCNTLVESKDWQNRSEPDRIKLFLAAFLHDVGKPLVTRLEDGRIVSPKHSPKGAIEARFFLWTKLGLNTDPLLIRFREEIVSLVRCHSYPFHFIDRPDLLREAVSFSWRGSNEELAILSESDFRGRDGNDLSAALERIEFFREYIRENNVADEPWRFTSRHSAFAYFAGRLAHPAETLYDDCWGEIVLMSGPPAAGKDTYIREHYSDRPNVSIDLCRKRLGIGWTEDQTRAVAETRREATELLRQKIPFVWNATHLRKEFRQSAIRLCADYGARIRIVWREASLEELRRRNAKRDEPIVDSAFDKIFHRMEPPTILESDSYELNGEEIEMRVS